MSLLLTRTCEYAILVSLQKGRLFSHSTEHDIFIQSKLELRLPAAVDDLIPPASSISTAPVSISREGDVDFYTTMAYLISTKLLQRLREYDCEIMLHVKSVTTDAMEKTLGTFRLRVADAKMVVHHGPAAGMDKVNRFVADRGEWQRLQKGQEVKAGLFIVAMPNEKSTTAVAAADALSSIRSPPNDGVNSPMMELKSLDLMSHTPSTPLLFSDSVTTSTTTILSSPSSQHSFKRSRQNIDLNIERLTNEFRQIKLKQPPQQPTSLHHQRHQQHQPQDQQQQDQQVLSSRPSPSPPSPSPARLSWPLATRPPPPSPSLTKNNNKQLPYHQIGKGLSQYTFYFRIIDADHYRPTPRLNRRRGVARKPYFTYRFLSHSIQCPASSISTRSSSSAISKWPTCFHLRGHLVDIQQWLNNLRFLEVSLLICDEDTGDNNNTSTGLLSKETVVGMAHVPLANLTFYRRSREQRQSLYESVSSGNTHAHRSSSNSHCSSNGGVDGMHPNFVERTFPIHGLNQPRWWRHHRREREEAHQEQLNKDKGDAIATVTVRLGLASGWWTGDREEDTNDDEDMKTTAIKDNKEERGEKSNRTTTTTTTTTTSFAKRPMSTYDLLDWFKKKKAKVPSHHTSTS